MPTCPRSKSSAPAFTLATLSRIAVSPDQLVAALAAQNLVRPAGMIRLGEEAIALRVSGAFTSERDLLDVNVMAEGRLLRLRDIATVRRGNTDPPQPFFRVNGREALGLAIAMRDGTTSSCSAAR